MALRILQKIRKASTSLAIWLMTRGCVSLGGRGGREAKPGVSSVVDICLVEVLAMSEVIAEHPFRSQVGGLDGHDSSRDNLFTSSCIRPAHVFVISHGVSSLQLHNTRNLHLLQYSFLTWNLNVEPLPRWSEADYRYYCTE